MTPTQMRARMDQLTGQLMKSIGDNEPFEKRETLWMEREGLRDHLSQIEAVAA